MGDRAAARAMASAKRAKTAASQRPNKADGSGVQLVSGPAVHSATQCSSAASEGHNGGKMGSEGSMACTLAHTASDAAHALDGNDTTALGMRRVGLA